MSQLRTRAAWGMRSRVTILATVIVLGVLLLTAITLLETQRLVLTDSVDETLARHSATVERSVAPGSTPRALQAEGDEEAFAILTTDGGRAIASTPGAPSTGILDDPAAPELSGSPGYFSIPLPERGDLYRVRVERSGEFTIVVGTPLDDVVDQSGALTRGLAVAVPLASALLAAMVWMIVGRVLAPVERIRSRVADITGANLHARVPEPATRDEISRLARTMNDMLDRLDSSAERQRALVADASHELRSPLARLRSELEVDLAHPDSADTRSTLLSALAEVDGMQRLVEDLLMLARGEDNDPLRNGVSVDLDDVLLRELSRVRAAHDVRIDASQVSGAQVVGNEEQLGRVIRNLLDNAARHGRSPITVSLGERAGEAVLVVEDSGDGIPRGEAGKVFERFWQADGSRGHHEGAGLGLAIAREIVHAHRGRIVVGAADSGGARFIVSFPVDRRDAPRVRGARNGLDRAKTV